MIFVHSPFNFCSGVFCFTPSPPVLSAPGITAYTIPESCCPAIDSMCREQSLIGFHAAPLHGCVIQLNKILCGVFWLVVLLSVAFCGRFCSVSGGDCQFYEFLFVHFLSGSRCSFFPGSFGSFLVISNNQLYSCVLLAVRR